MSPAVLFESAFCDIRMLLLDGLDIGVKLQADRGATPSSARLRPTHLSAWLDVLDPANDLRITKTRAKYTTTMGIKRNTSCLS